MTRKKATPVADPPSPAAAFDLVRAEMDSDAFDDGMPYDRNRVLAKLRFFSEQASKAMLEMGACLIQMKAHEPHGQFTALVEETLGIKERQARRFMAATRRFSAQALSAKRPTLTVLPPSKLFALLDETDEALIELADGGEIAGMTLADIGAASVRELIGRLAEARKVAEARQRVIDKQQEKIADQAERLNRPFNPTPGVEARTRAESERLKELNQYVANAETAIAQLLAFTNEAIDQEWLAYAARQGVERVTLRAAELADRHNLAGAARSA